MMPTPTDPPQKVVYVLGAGFSKPAGAPSQDEILGEILQLGEANGRVSEAKRNLREFLSGDLNLDIEHPERIALEDIYTPIDRCIADGTSLKGRTSANLSELREHLGGLISRAISAAIARHFAGNTGSSGYVHDFASYVVAKAARRGALAASAARIHFRSFHLTGISSSTARFTNRYFANAQSKGITTRLVLSTTAVTSVRSIRETRESDRGCGAWGVVGTT